MAHSRVPRYGYTGPPAAKPAHTGTEGEERTGATERLEESVVYSPYLTHAESKTALWRRAGDYALV